MQIDQKRIKDYLFEIKRNSAELEDILKQYPDDKILKDLFPTAYSPISSLSSNSDTRLFTGIG